MLSIYVLSCLLLFGAHAEDEVRFPDDFFLGFATASYQIEGAWNEDGKGENVWDRLTHTRPDRVVDASTGDIADDSYHKYKEDIQLLKNLGAQVYRFSLSWSRILPTGDVDIINQPGIDYYNNVINELLANDIQPMITLFHWDLPQPLQDLGGWPNPILAEYFAEYARVAYKNFGDRVKWWITFNEPYQTCHASYGQNEQAPAVNSHGVGEYLCTHTLLKAHAKAYHIYDAEFRPSQNGKCGITLSGGWYEPKTNSTEDIEAAEVGMQFEVGWFATPIYSAEGDYPKIMRERVDANSKAEGRPRSRLPSFTSEEVGYIKGTSDFFGCNHYTTHLATPATLPVGDDPSIDRDMAIEISDDPAWPGSASAWLKVVPKGIREHVNWIKNTYGDVPIIITENGFSDYGDIQDKNRIHFYNAYLHELLKAVYDDGCNVLGYTAWSLLDNFEWERGYTERFGIYHVDFEDPNRARSPKASVDYWKQVTSTRTLPPLDSTRNDDGFHLFSNRLFRQQ